MYENVLVYLNRNDYDGRSLFHIETKSVLDVCDVDGNRIKYHYNISENLLIVFGDHESIITKIFI